MPSDDTGSGAPLPSHAERGRTLLAGGGSGTLSTLAREPAGFPFGSLVLYAAEGADVLFLLSELAEHTRNLRADSRASLLVAESGAGDPLAQARVTLLGRCTPVSGEQRERARAAYLARHPSAVAYASFSDFALWRLEVSDVRLVAGFGRMAWVTLAEWHAAQPDPIAPDAAAILEHMNQDHADALPLYARALGGVAEVERVEMTHIDRLGFELTLLTAAGPQQLRLGFPEPIASKTDARKALVALLGQSRQALGLASPRGH